MHAHEANILTFCFCRHLLCWHSSFMSNVPIYIESHLALSIKFTLSLGAGVLGSSQVRWAEQPEWCIYHVICYDLWWPQYWPDKKSYKSCRSSNELSNAICHSSLRFKVFEIWRGPKRPPARFRAFQSPSGIGLGWPDIWRQKTCAWRQIQLTFWIVVAKKQTCAVCEIHINTTS